MLLTFDDAYKSVLLNAYPVLKKYHFHAVCFVVSGWLFDKAQDYTKEYSVCMSKDELLSMKDLFEYGNHTAFFHTRKEGKPALLTETKENFLKDLSQCEAFVSTKKIFAYPYGIYKKENLDWLKEFGTLLAFTSDEGLNTKETNPLELHRNACLLQYSIDDFKNMLKV